jgi:hypothetical protein
MIRRLCLIRTVCPFIKFSMEYISLVDFNLTELFRLK